MARRAATREAKTQGLQCPVMAAAGRSCQSKGRPEDEKRPWHPDPAIHGPWPWAMAAWPMDLTRHLPGQKAYSTTHLHLDPCACLCLPAGSTAAQRHARCSKEWCRGVGLPPGLPNSSSLRPRSVARMACSTTTTSHGDHRGCGLRLSGIVADPLLRCAGAIHEPSTGSTVRPTRLCGRWGLGRQRHVNS